MTSDVSADGRLAVVAGDNRNMFDAADGRILWPSPNPPDDPNCYGTRLRLSPTAKWAAGAGYDKTMGVFSTASGGSPWQAVTTLSTGCFDVAAFSRDETLMATSRPALYRTGASSGDWQQLWGTPIPGAPDDPRQGWAARGNDVRFSPDDTQVLVSRCEDRMCITRLHAVADGAVLQALPMLTAPHPAFSPEGPLGRSGRHAPSSSVWRRTPARSIGIPQCRGLRSQRRRHCGHRRRCARPILSRPAVTARVLGIGFALEPVGAADRNWGLTTEGSS
jgi:hypothetical protein